MSPCCAVMDPRWQLRPLRWRKMAPVVVRSRGGGGSRLLRSQNVWPYGSREGKRRDSNKARAWMLEAAEALRRGRYKHMYMYRWNRIDSRFGLTVDIFKKQCRGSTFVIWIPWFDRSSSYTRVNLWFVQEHKLSTFTGGSSDKSRLTYIVVANVKQWFFLISEFAKYIDPIEVAKRNRQLHLRGILHHKLYWRRHVCKEKSYCFFLLKIYLSFW